MNRKMYVVMAAFMLASGLIGSLVTQLVIGHQARAQASQVTAERVVLVDPFGRQRASLELTRFGGVQLTVEGWNMVTPRASLSVEPSGSAGLDLRDYSNRVRASLSLTADGAPFLAFMDQWGNVIWSAP